MIREAPHVRRPSVASPGRVVRATVLGGLEVAVAGHVVERVAWQRISAERLVKLLLVTPGHRLSRETAAEILWPDATPDASRAGLRKAIHFAHQALDGSDALVTDTRSVWFDASRLELDLDRLQAAFDVLATGGVGTEPARARPDGVQAMDRATETVLALGSLELLPDDPYEDWLFAPRERLRSRWQTLALEGAREAHARGRLLAAHELIEQLLERDPTDEAAHRVAIELYAEEGRHHAARRQLELCRAALRESLDADPSPETEAVLQTSVARAERAGTQPPVPRLVARRDELQRVEPLLDRIAAGRPAVLLIRGPTGIGKSRLLGEVVSYGRAAGWSAIEWQAVEATRSLAYGPFRFGLAGAVGRDELSALDEPGSSAIATVAPDLGLRPGVAFAERPALVAALVAALERVAQQCPLVIAIDDLPWLDPASYEVLDAIISGLAQVPVLIAGTVRDDEPAAGTTTAFSELVRRTGGLDLPLRPLAQRDVEPLVLAHFGGDSVEPGLARLAFERSAGNPLFLLECLRAGRDRGWVRLSGARWSAAGSPVDEVPDSVRRLVAARTGRLAGPARDLLAAAAELGSAVSFDALAAMLPGLPGGLVVALDDALESGLLQERGTGYAFAHPLYRLAVHESTRFGRRGTFRIAAARALAGVRSTATADELVGAAAASSDPASVADHALAACAMGIPGAAELAVAFGFEAGDRERRLFDQAAATDFLERSMDVWRHLPPGAASTFAASTAWTRLGGLCLVRGDEEAAMRACREAIGTARNPGELASAYIALHYVPYRHGDFDSGLSILDEALARLQEGAEPWRARVQAEVGWLLLRLRRLPESLVALEASVATLDRVDDRPGAMRALDALGVVLRMLGRDDESIARLDRSLSLSLDLHDSRGELWARIHLCGSLTQAGRPGRARPHAERSLELAMMMGDRYLESVAAWKAAEMMDALDDVAAAIGLRRRELALLAGIGGNAHNETLAHAHLAVLLARDGARSDAAAEARLARALSVRSEEAGYADRIERALRMQDWKDLDHQGAWTSPSNRGTPEER